MKSKRDRTVSRYVHSGSDQNDVETLPSEATELRDAVTFE